jgi:hypothetical protein
LVWYTDGVEESGQFAQEMDASLCSKIKINAGGVDQRLGRQSNRDSPIKMAMKRRKTMGIAGTPEAHLEHRVVA